MKIHVISPAFHGYWRSIVGALERRGHLVTSHLYDLHPGISDKLSYHLREELPSRLGIDVSAAAQQATDSAVAKRVRQVAPDVVLVVKCDQLGEHFWSSVGTIPVVLWLYDELRRTQHTDATLAPFTAIASYSRDDVANLEQDGYQARHVPLAYDPHVRFQTVTSSDLVFVGARYPDRERLLTDLHGAGVQIRAYGRDWSHDLRDRLRTWSVRRSQLPAGGDLLRPEAYGVMAGARGCLNTHGDQDGFTMRTFEAAGVGAVQLIDRAEVSEFYDPGTEVAVFSNAAECAELARKCDRDPAWAAGIRAAGRARTLAEHTFDHRIAELESLWA